MHEITILYQLGAGRPEALTLPAGATVRDAREAKSVPTGYSATIAGAPASDSATLTDGCRLVFSKNKEAGRA